MKLDYKQLAAAFKQADKQREIENARKLSKAAKKLEVEAQKKAQEEKMKEVFENAQKMKDIVALAKAASEAEGGGSDIGLSHKKKGFKSLQVKTKDKEFDPNKTTAKRKLNPDVEGYDFGKWQKGQVVGNQSVTKNPNFIPVTVSDRLWRLSDAPEDLFTREEVEGMPACDYVLHLIRYVAREWQTAIREGKKVEYTEHNKLTVGMIRVFESHAELTKTMTEMEPLLRRLSKDQLIPVFLDKYEKIVDLMARREYKLAYCEYTDLTMNHKTQHWRQPNMQHRVQQNHGGGIQRIYQTSEYSEFDTDPEAIVFTKAFKRFFQYLQYLRPGTLENNFI